jgi:hypothetical protein
MVQKRHFLFLKVLTYSVLERENIVGKPFESVIQETEKDKGITLKWALQK